MKIIVSLGYYVIFIISQVNAQQYNFFPISIGNEYQFKARNFQEYYFLPY